MARKRNPKHNRRKTARYRAQKKKRVLRKKGSSPHGQRR